MHCVHVKSALVRLNFRYPVKRVFFKQHIKQIVHSDAICFQYILRRQIINFGAKESSLTFNLAEKIKNFKKPWKNSCLGLPDKVGGLKFIILIQIVNARILRLELNLLV